ncbi:5-carboxymethyl-2-hydroxymuconate Delta-isomerase [Sulfitobacter sp. HGT1]|uniref:5-carboxymethyl-2-hydroxymuconate Delta-isomerase n=1 Tax=Sulfitobacter sp. HGT1 TaxID=2735435 RepID=UPI001594014E|nr:5-carboxymethyl-2-hydroxymuconate Delta-isomerase [Sulfitobacter sp. HGT1]
MPHLHIDYSPNLAARLDVAALCQVVADAAAKTGVFPVAGIRVRATACTHVVMADGNPDHAFLDLSVRLAAGRADSAKQAAAKAIFQAMEAFCAPVMASSSFMLSMEMREIDPALSFKSSSIRQYLPKELQ